MEVTGQLQTQAALTPIKDAGVNWNRESIWRFWEEKNYLTSSWIQTPYGIRQQLLLNIFIMQFLAHTSVNFVF